jgi:hypothetical protein
MREDDDAPDDGAAPGSLADGLGETAGDDHSSSADPYGDDGYGDDGYGEDSYDDGTYGDGDTGTDTDADTTDTVDDEAGGGGEPDTSELPDADDAGIAPDEPLAQDVSPLEGVGFILDELRDALFGEEEADAAAFAPDPADLVSGTDLDLTGDGTVDRADLREAESPFDFHVDPSDHGHDGGVIDA